MARASTGFCGITSEAEPVRILEPMQRLTTPMGAATHIYRTHLTFTPLTHTSDPHLSSSPLIHTSHLHLASTPPIHLSPYTSQPLLSLALLNGYACVAHDSLLVRKSYQLADVYCLHAVHCLLSVQGNCSAVHSAGSYLAIHRVRGLVGCLRVCAGCANCRFISYSLFDNDCSWYTDCSLKNLHRLDPPTQHVSLRFHDRGVQTLLAQAQP